MIAFITCSMTKSVTPSRVDLPEQLHRALDLRRVQARHDFVEQEQLGIHRQRLGELQPLQVRDRQVRRRVGDAVPEPDLRQDLARRARAPPAAVRSFPRAPNIAPIATLSRTESCFKGLTTWNVRAMPEPADGVARRLRDVLSPEENRPGRRLVEPRDAVDEGRLARRRWAR